MKSDLICFLEAFEHTGIYIIDRKTMEVYYENKTALKYTGRSRVGETCYLVHENGCMCASCPLRRENRTSFVIREDLGMVLVVQATAIMWQGQESYAIFVRKQLDMPQRKLLTEGMTKRMNRALNSSILTYCEINMKTYQSKSIFFSNPEVNHVVEEPYEEHLREQCKANVYEADQQRVQTQLGLSRLRALSADSEGPSEFSVRYRSSGRRKGRSIVIESTAYILRDELPHHVSIITKEVTQQERCEMKLQLYSEASQNTVSMFQINLTTNTCVSVSTHLPADEQERRRVFDCETVDELFDYFTSHIPEGQNKKEATLFFSRKHMLKAFADGRSVLEHRFPIYREDQVCKWVMIGVNMIKNPLTEEVEGILHTEEIEDVIVKDNLIAQVVNNDYDYLILIDLQNNSAKAFTNYGLFKPMMNENASQYIIDYIRRTYVGDDLEEFTRKNEIPYVLEQLKLQTKYEEYYYVEEKNMGVRYKKGTYSYANGDHRYLLFSRTDNTDAIEEQKRINEQLREALAASDNANKSKTEIFSRMSHDLRTPMNAIVGMANLGYDEAVAESSRHYFEKIEMSGNYLLGLINDILDMNKLENGSVVLNEEPVDAKLLLSDVIAILQPVLAKRNIQLAADFDGIKTAYIFCDAVRTRQIFFNFLSNAVKFSPVGSTVEWTATEQGTKNGRVYFESKFIDHGCGMSPEFQKKAFEPFEQEINEYSAENSSTGLGLAITKNLVSIMGGDIELQSELHKGTCFTLHLNHKIAKPEDVAKQNETIDLKCLSGKRILAVEDHPLNLEIEKKLLLKKEMLVEVARDGQEAVDIFAQAAPGYFDAILMDVRMPGMDGLEATRRIRALDKTDAVQVPIIATTANAFDEDRRATKEAGMNAHLSKPIIPKQLYATLQSLLSNKEREI